MKRTRYRLLLVYLLLLGASTLVRWQAEGDGVLDPGKLRVAIESSEQTIEVAYRQWVPSGSQQEEGPELAPIVFLHGSPGSSRDFEALAPQLGLEAHRLAPDLPGFGDSTREVEDYSVRSHASMTLEWLDALGVEAVHLVGFSMGGGVALEMIDQAPERVRSLTLLSAIGVQELELLGDYSLNHAVHGVQLAALWVLREATPHFGAFDDTMLSVEYARNFFDTDQRPLRGILEAVEVPTLIVHGRSDPLVPLAAAEEHHRLVPHSEIEVYDASHFMVFRGPQFLVDRLTGFLTAVEEGRGLTRETASPARENLSKQPYNPDSAPAFGGFLLWWIALLLAAATLVSEDLTCIGAGLLVSQGRLGLAVAVIACALGILIGDLALYGAGRFLGRRGLHRRPWRWVLSPAQVEASSRWFEERGAWVILSSRFLPGARLPTYFAAGLLRAGFWRFLGWFALAVALWTPILVGLAALLGKVMIDYFEVFRRYALPGLVAVVVVIYGVSRLLPALGTHLGRRRLLGRWRRLRHWEFWPRWAFYPPVVFWVLGLGLRYRSLTLFTAANPGMPEGGFVGESKGEILDRLATDQVAPYRRLGGSLALDQRLRGVEQFAAEQDGWPVVLKPDVGQRGEGVQIVHSPEEAAGFFESHSGEAIVQAFVPGVELGVFYLRFPAQERGSIFSVTDKQMPTVVGDGEHTLERLILDDDRAVCMASLYLERFADRRFTVPAAGEQIALAELGTHCLGAVFLDGSEYVTEALEETVESIAHSFEGFYFGRFDLRAPSYDHFRYGEGIQVIELNGVTSEATHIYDPSNRLLAAYSVLFRQWALAFEIGEANRSQGYEVAGVGALVRRLGQYWRG